MKRALPLLVALAWCAGAFAAAERAPGRPAADDTYTITSTIEVVQPFDPAAMQDDFQDVRVLKQDDKTCTFEVTYYPLYQPAIRENRNWRRDYAGMTEYLRPTPAENWDEPMRQDLLKELRAAKIDPDELTDKQLVEKVSRWAMSRARSTHAFAIWAIHFPDGKPAVYAPLRDAFNQERPNAGYSDERMFEEEALGRSMFYFKVHGSCTSSSIYLSTIFRALGIPTRVVFCIPPFDPNDAAQAKLFYDAIHHHQARATVHAALDGVKGFDNHLFNEVYVGNRWVRLNYSTLGQPILDAKYFGLLTHIYTASDMSKAPLAETWGMRYFAYPAGQPRFSSPNPYRLLAVHDRFGPDAKIENPESPELRTATIIHVYRPGAPDLAALTTWPVPGRNGDLLLRFREWVPGTYVQMRDFEKKVGHDFLLTAPGQPVIRAKLSGVKLSKGDGSFQAFELNVLAADRDKIASGVSYTLNPVDVSETYRWVVAPEVGAFKLKD